MIVAMVAALRAGAAYVPIEPSQPLARAIETLDDADVDVILTTPGAFPATGMPERPLVVVDERAGSPTTVPATAPSPLVDDSDPAYVIYTSGSTGRPKGVVATHRNVLRLFRTTARWFPFGPDQVWSMTHSYAFDFSVWEIWGALLHGGHLVIAPYWTVRSPEALLDFLGEQEVTMLSQTPTAFAELMRADEERGGRDRLALEHVVLGGEALAVEGLVPWMVRRGENAPSIINMYGITETTVHVTYHHVTLEEARAGHDSIGVPLPDLCVELRDEHGAVLHGEAEGEMYVTGPGVTLGYLHRPEETAAAFSTDDGPAGERTYRTGDFGRRLADGTLQYRGRRDGQVKIRGHRIETGEVEAVLRRHEWVGQVAVRAIADRTGTKSLAAFVVPSPETADLLLRRLRVERESLPAGAAFKTIAGGVPFIGRRQSELDFMVKEFDDQSEQLPGAQPRPEDEVIFDVGANVGVFTLLASTLAPAARIFAFEPVPELRELLEMNVALHGAHASVEGVALGRQPGEGLLTYYPNMSIMSGLHADVQRDSALVTTTAETSNSTASPTALVDVVDDAFARPVVRSCVIRTLSDVVDEHDLTTIDLLKIDVERAELDVLGGLESRHWPLVKRVAVETEEDNVDAVVAQLHAMDLQTEVARVGALRETALLTVVGHRNVSSTPEARKLSDLTLPDPMDSATAERELRAFAEAHLPQYMVPSSVVWLDGLPSTANGKLDHVALEQELEARRRRAAPPETAVDPLTKQVSAVFAQALALASVGADDDFFTLGGHSILAAQTVALLRKEGLTVALRTLFDHPTPAGLARALRGVAAEDG
jgi:amino acid adenylation domain-containing protein/FkbM family methyltransferase